MISYERPSSPIPAAWIDVVVRCELEVVGVGAGVRCFERGAGESAGHRCEFFLGRGLFSFGWGAHLVLALGYVDFSDWRLIVRIGDDFWLERVSDYTYTPHSSIYIHSAVLEGIREAYPPTGSTSLSSIPSR